MHGSLCGASPSLPSPQLETSLSSPANEPGLDQIVGSNDAVLSAAVTAWVGVAVDLGIVPDSIEEIADAVARAKDADILITTEECRLATLTLSKRPSASGFVIDFLTHCHEARKPLMFGQLKARCARPLGGEPPIFPQPRPKG